MIDFPLYRITDEHNREVLTEDPAIAKMIVMQLLEDNDIVEIRREDNERI